MDPEYRACVRSKIVLARCRSYATEPGVHRSSRHRSPPVPRVKLVVAASLPYSPVFRAPIHCTIIYLYRRVNFLSMKFIRELIFESSSIDPCKKRIFWFKSIRKTLRNAFKTDSNKISRVTFSTFFFVDGDGIVAGPIPCDHFSPVVFHFLPPRAL